MNSGMYFALLGTIWIAPHTNKMYSRVVGIVFCTLAILDVLGVLK